MSHSITLVPGDIGTSKYIITHVFCPLQLPDGDDHSVQNGRSLARAVATAARLYSKHIGEANIALWYSVSRMLQNLQAIMQFESLDRFQTISQFSSMDVGDVVALLIRAQNAGVVFRKQKDFTIFESFELSPKGEDVMTTKGKLICSYPGPAIEISNFIFDDKYFLSELVNFLAHMNHDNVNVAWQSCDSKDTVHPRCVTELLTGILRSVGRPANISRISKRVGDEAVCNDDLKLPWRRSSLWLLIRVALQTTLDRSLLGNHTYKKFMLFFMCHLVEEKTCADLSSDLLQFMLAKISRRLRKLGSSAPDWLSRIVSQACTSLRSTIENRWRQVQAAQRVSPPWTPSQLDLTRDTQLSFSSSEDYVRNSLADHCINPPNISFNPEHRRGALDDFLSADGDFFEEAYRVEPHVTLYDIEQAVEQDIDTWVGRVTNIGEACVRLETLADKYSSNAFKTYANNPELLSVMLLTMVELWAALDKLAVKEIPILADYSPEVPISLLENLLLWKTASRRRLGRAYIYLSHRHSRSRRQWSVFSPTITVDSFAVRFYRKSSDLQRLRTQIEQVAWGQVHKKVAELRGMNTRYAELRTREAEIGQVESSMDMRIDVYERPLPSDQLHAEVVVFELDCPVSFDMWRAATFHLLVDLCSAPFQQCDRPNLELNGYQPLEPFHVKHPRSRVSLASDTRPPHFSHPSVPIPAKQEQVCIHNGLSFFGFDMRTGIPIPQALGRIDSRGHCTYKLQSEPYLSLQKYVNSTFHTSNEVVANQADCHEDLSTHEYMAFGHLRSGGSLQWLNILREFRARSLTFRCHEVHMLLAQAVSQIGPLGNTGWTWHLEVQQPTFCYALLDELEGLVRDVEANWLEGVTMSTISHLLRRLLVSSPNDAVSLKTLDLLRLVRSKVFSWTQELSAELLMTPGDEGSHGVLRDTAAICRSTFDVDPAMIPEVLHSPEDIDVLLSCAIIIHDHMPSDVSSLPAYSQLLLDRDRHLALALESVVRDMILADSGDEGINLVIGRFWPDYHPGSKWSSLQDPSTRWFSCTTAPPGDLRPQVVHLNILDGSLLVNGKPLGSWLPNEFVRDPLYKLIFGEKMLTVTQSDLPEMDYSTRGLISDHRVYFTLRNNGSHLVIQAKRKEMGIDSSEVIELIPPRMLEGDLPAVLIKGHAHWLNLSTAVMEIRPLESLWEASPQHWKVDCTPGRYHARKGHERLVDVRSQSWDMVSSLLRPLSVPEDLIISVSPIEVDNPTSSLQLSVLLPRYDLSFYVDEDWELQSRNVQGMVYDENQSIGSLFGLVNRLVLRPKNKGTNALELIPRYVLIPDGDITFRIDGHHVCVEIATDRSVVERVTYQTYRINTDLGCLVGSASLTSKLYCAYLHALTSGCCDDPLTGRSGTEEALFVLRSASCWPNVRFGLRDAELLGLIASIYPTRTWDPKQSVQKVEWRNLPANSQNHEFYLLSKAIKERYERVRLFHESQPNSLFAKFPVGDDDLLKRSARRVAYLFPFELSRQPSEVNFDVRYPQRDIVGVASGEHRAYTAATYVYCRIATSKKDLWKMVESWTTNVSGLSGEIALSLQYDRSWSSLDFPSTWLKIYNLLRRSDERKWIQLLFSLPAMVFSSPSLGELVPVFVAFASHPRFRSEDPPHYDSYLIAEGCFPLSTTLHKWVIDCAYPLERSLQRLERAAFGESSNDLKHRQLLLYAKRRRLDANVATQEFLEAWPCETPPHCSLDPALYDVVDLESKVQQYFSNCFRNLKLKEHLTRAQTILNDLHSEASPPRGMHTYSFRPSQSIPSCIPWLPAVDQLFARPAPKLPAHEGLSGYATDFGNTHLNTSALYSESTPLHQLIATIWASPVNLFQRRYISALRRSAKCFLSEMALTHQKETNLPSADTLEEHYAWCKSSYTSGIQHLQRHLGPKNKNEQILEQSGQWPRITPHTLFRYLASNSPIKLSDDWKRCLVRFALLALELQRARRLFLLHIHDLHEDLYEELQNEGCDGWDPEAHPDWLLIQLQGNFLIRRIQAEVAYEIMSPRSGENTAMQLNMGEGKSSVIVPIAAAALANGDQLVRVIVPKPLTAQTLHILADRLGGLTNRRIYYLPFSRSLEMDHQKVALLREIMLECLRERGILVVQPEHVLSLKLVSVEKQLSRAEDGQVARLLLELQRWLHSRSREILDESDEILDVRSQLVFTIGRQQHVEGAPERWTTTQQVLGLVSKHASSLRQLFPLGVEYEPGPPGSFPYVRILQVDAGQKLISWIVQDIVDGLLLNISFGQLYLRSDLRDAIRSFISSEDVSPATVQLVKLYSEQTRLWNGLLLLRGLLATGSLLFAFRDRRWRVDYGLAPARTMLAVPYRAKDVPAQRAEFGHPEIAIILTCLSYYYDGLTEEHLRVSFGILLKQHDASSDYDLWVRACPTIPESLRTLSGVNIKSTEQWNKSIFPLFSRNRATVDFYLSRVVFPREANEFPSKLSSSGCDLAEKKERLVTGFSGTNDGQFLLPLHIVQRDPDHQRGTNAKVLSYLLQPENNHYMCMAHLNGNRRPTREFLEILVSQKPEIRVLLDVGAQMLDLQNHELAKVWLDITPNASAAIYFNEVDELTVLTRDGSTQLLLSSPYAEQLDRCVVYLDDAHTRGTDIKFPTGFRAAVTLGPKVTKDRLTQGCMRMRKMGNGHSVMFFAPLEVDQRIRSLAEKVKGSSGIIDTIDILHWTIRETWENIQRWAPHWVQQGMDHASRYAAWSSFCGDQLTLGELSDRWLQPATKKLEDLYIPRNTSNPASIVSPDIRQRYSDLGVLSPWSVGVDEEQVRELVHEVKRQAERPPNVQPADHSIHRDVADFIKTGVIPKRTGFMAWTRIFTTWTKAFTPAFETLHATSATSNESYVWSQSVLVTMDFEQTVKMSGEMDDYLRPVHWILSAKTATNDLLVILSPHEANCLLPNIRSSKKVHLHLYTPRITKSMKPCDDLALYNIPSVPNGWIPPYSFMDQLNVFAGQLYLRDYQTYIRLCRFLCLYSRDLEENKYIIKVEPDGFIMPENRTQTLIAHTFSCTPVPFLKVLMNLRSKGVNFSSTHIGRLLRGQLLSEDDFDGWDLLSFR